MDKRQVRDEQLQYYDTEYEYVDDSENEEDEELDERNKEIGTEEDIIKKYVDGQLRIVRTTMDFSLYNLKQVIGDSDYIDTMPSYQRRNRWDKKKKSLLIESLLLNVPIPPIFLFEKDYNSYEVMDGRQRLKSITDFLEDDFALTSLEFWKELEGSKFSMLPDVLRKGLLRRTISAIVLLAETKSTVDDLDVRMVLFNRLNTGGIQLNPQELRNALYPGSFNDLLLRLSRSEDFTLAWNIPPKTENEHINPSTKLVNNKLYASMTDCELVLRFFAIRETILMDIKGSLRDILDKCMKRHKDDNSEEIKILQDLFHKCIRELNKLFDGQPFYLNNTNRNSQPLYDALMVAFSLIDERQLKSKEVIQKRLKAHLENTNDYQILTGKGNTVKAIKSRIELAKTILVG